MRSFFASTMINSTYTSAIKSVIHSQHLFGISHFGLQIIETAARERFNESAALVIRATLKATESKQNGVSDIRSGLPYV